ncbi:MAG: MFS transporter [Gammaproteobacteria bacterium]|nr:MFS transporter [Gammaproteobacteria bacterium]
MSEQAAGGFIGRVLSVRPDERKAALFSFIAFFTILCAYFLLRPVRDEMAILAGPENIPDLFVATFIATIVLVPVFGWATRRFQRRRLLPGLFVFFVINLLAFYWAFGNETVDTVLVARSFFVWLSVFNMFVVSLFWSFMSDIYTREQARRLFGLIAGGGSAGAILGPLITTLLVEHIGIANLFLISASLLSCTLVAIVMLLRWAAAHVHNEHPVTEQRPLGGGVLAGFQAVVRDRYLLGIAAYFLLGTFCGTAMYLLQAQVFSAEISDSLVRTKLLGAMDTSINVIALLLQVFVARHAIARLGVPTTLMLLPALSLIAFVGVALVPSLALVIVFQVTRRATNFGLMGPARENLWTVVSAEEKYKAKNFLDVTVVRGADVISSQSIRAIQNVFASFAPVAWLCAGLAAAWLLIVRRVGLTYRERFERQ